MYKCERCGKEVLEKFGSGRFCSRACANSRIHSRESREKVSKTMKTKPHGFWSEGYTTVTVECPVCGRIIRKSALWSHSRVHEGLARNRVGNVLNITKLELEQYQQRHTVCEICGRPSTTRGNSKKKEYNNLCIDHDHNTGTFRGLLCSVCNRQLGWYEKNRENIEKYLSK